jgi:hypothetical protein
MHCLLAAGLHDELHQPSPYAGIFFWRHNAAKIFDSSPMIKIRADEYGQEFNVMGVIWVP